MADVWKLRQPTRRTGTAAAVPARIHHHQIGLTQNINYQGHGMATRDIEPLFQEALIMKSLSQFLKTSAPICQTALLDAKNNKAWCVNDNDDVQHPSAKTNRGH